jgi:hypothetical protein
MSGFWDGVGKVFGKIADNIQGRTERNKNELEALKREDEALTKGEWDEKKSKRLGVVRARIDVLNGLLKNSAKD